MNAKTSFSIELLVKDVTGYNRYYKLQQAARALSDAMGLDAAIELPYMEKAKTHKYVSKKWVADHWEYTYPQANNERRANAASQIELITGIQPLSVNPSNVVNIGRNYFKVIQQAIDRGVKCKWLQNRRVAGIVTDHFFEVHGKTRPMSTILERAALLPFVLPIIEKYGHVSHVRKNDSGGYYYELVGKAEINGKKHAITLVLTDRGKDLLYISVFGLQNKMIKSLARETGSLHRGPIATVGKLASSSLNRDFIIPDISGKSTNKMIKPLDIEVFIKNITPENRKIKFAKAIRAVSRRLNVPVSVESKAHGHEPYLYHVQQQLADLWAAFYSPILREVYETVIAALGLPRVEVETMRKAIGGDDEPLRYIGFGSVGKLLHKLGFYKGKVIYNPETGQPIKQKDFDGMIEAIQKFLHRNTKDAARRLVLDAATIGKLLRRMARHQSSADMQRLKLENLKYRGKTFDWIRQDFKNLTDVLGHPLSGSEMARYQVANDYVAELVTRADHKIRDEIKETVLQGIINKRSRSQVSQDLFNRLGGLNRDWKRIADTEIANTSNLAGILEEVNSAPDGEKVYFRRYELPGCCEKCAKLDGAIALWSNTPLADENIKDPVAKVAIWEGKPPAAGKTVLVTGALHPNCRGGWLRWGGTRVDAMIAQVEGKGRQWDAAVDQARKEYQEKGTKNPNDQTPGYVERINELYREKLGEKE